MKTRILIPYCLKHNKFKKYGKWFNAGKDKKSLLIYMMFVLNQEISKSPMTPITVKVTIELCDECNV